MLGRIAACAAIIFIWPICTHASDWDGPLLLSEIVIASDPQPGRSAPSDHDADLQTAPPESAALANIDERFSADANASSAAQSPIASETEPFGLNAEPVVAGEILRKWGSVEAQIKAESRILARCRGGAFWCPLAGTALFEDRQ
jgi:hypothetical protein